MTGANKASADHVEISQQAVEAVADVVRVPPAEVTGARSLFDLPGFDSLAVVAVLERLESALGVEVPPELIVPEAFESITALSSLLTQTTAASSVQLATGGPA
jgi:acyl carrier protein